MCKTNRLGMPYFEVLACSVIESEQLFVVTDSASAVEICKMMTKDTISLSLSLSLSLSGAADFFPLYLTTFTSFKAILSQQNS